jgi:CheY-like chemotaxis protein
MSRASRNSAVRYRTSCGFDTLTYNDGMAKVLIVDDDADCCEGQSKVLRIAGHEVHCAANGREALTHVINQLPDVILLDLAMPVMDGASFLEVLRSYLRLQSLPVIVLTGLPDSAMAERVTRLKVDCVLAKGKASSAEIMRAVEEAVGG